MKEITALLLAGGKSQRMGTNKAFLSHEDRPFIEHILKSVSIFDQVIIMANDVESYQHLGVDIVPDQYPGCGPMSGLQAGLSVAKHAYCLLVPCDMPNIDEKIVSFVAENIEEGYDAFIPQTADGKVHPLLAIYHKRILPQVEESLDQGHYKMMRFLDQLKVKHIDVNEKIFDVKRILSNVNTPEEFQRLKEGTKDYQESNYLMNRIDNEKNSKNNRPPVIAISGVSNSGKTTVLTKAIALLKEKGYTIGTIKHDGHGFEMDKKGKDTYRHREAGADGVIIASRHQYAMIQQTPQKEIDLDELIALQSHHDIVLLEGFKFCRYPKFEVVRKERSSETVCDRDTLLGVVTDVDMQVDDIPVLDLQDTIGLVEAIENYVKEYNHER